MFTVWRKPSAQSNVNISAQKLAMIARPDSQRPRISFKARMFQGFRGCSLVLLLAIALSSGLCLCFDAGKLYTYSVLGSVATGPEGGEKFVDLSGYNFSSTLLVHGKAHNELVVQLRRPRFATVNPFEIGDGEKFVVESNDLRRALNSTKFFDSQLNPFTLGLPFSVYFKDGAIEAFDKYNTEPKWVTNFKRGILNLLLLNQTDHQDLANYTERIKLVDDCQYQIGVGKFGMEKRRLEETCLNKRSHRIMPTDVDECVTSGNGENGGGPAKGSAAVMWIRFELADDPQASPTINRALLNEEIVRPPFGLSAGNHTIRTRFEMSLLRVQQEAKFDKPECCHSRCINLQYELPETQNFYADVDLREAHYYANILETNVSIGQMMRVLMKYLVAENERYRMESRNSLDHSFAGATEFSGAKRLALENTRMNFYFEQVSLLVGSLDYVKLELLYGQFNKEKKGIDFERIFWDLLSVAGTNPSVVFARKLIDRGEVPRDKIRDYLAQLSFHIKAPSKKLFDEYLRLCQSANVQADKQARRTCLLTLASLIHQHCVKPHARALREAHSSESASPLVIEDKSLCRPETAEEYFTSMVVGGSNKSSAENIPLAEKFFNAKLAGELAVSSSVDYIDNIILDAKKHSAFRAAAMGALAKSASLYPGPVKRSAMKIFHDTKQRTHSRIGAFEAWSLAGMSGDEFKGIVANMTREPDKRLVDYMHSHIRALAAERPVSCSAAVLARQQSVSPEMIAQIEMARTNRNLSIWRKSHERISANWRPARRDEPRNGAIHRNLLVYNDDTYLLPAQWSFETADVVDGAKINRLRVSLRLVRLNTTIYRLLDMLDASANFFDLFSQDRGAPKKRQASPSTTTAHSSKIKPTANEFNGVYMSLTISEYGRPLLHLDLDTQDLVDMFAQEDGTIKMPPIEKLLEPWHQRRRQWHRVMMEQFELRNNAMGLPLVRKSYHAKSELQRWRRNVLQVKPAFFERDRAGHPASQVSLSLKVDLEEHDETFSWTGAILPHSSHFTGLGLFRRTIFGFPVRLSFNADLDNQRARLEFDTFQENMYSVNSTQVAFSLFTLPEGSQDDGIDFLTALNPEYLDASRPNQLEDFKIVGRFGLKNNLVIAGKYGASKRSDNLTELATPQLSNLAKTRNLFQNFPPDVTMEMRASSLDTDDPYPSDNNVTILAFWGRVERDVLPSESQKAPKGLKLSFLSKYMKDPFAKFEIGYTPSSSSEPLKWHLNYDHSPSKSGASFDLNEQIAELMEPIELALNSGDMEIVR